MHRAFVLSTALLGFALARPAAADIVLVNQQPTGTPSEDNVNSHYAPDVPQTTRGFDDFTLTHWYNLTSFRAYGYDDGTPAKNMAVTAEIRSTAGLGGPVLLSAIGTEVGNDLVFDFGGGLLGPGHYWITAFVTRNFDNGGGTWYWLFSRPVSGSEAKWQPGGSGPPSDIADLIRDPDEPRNPTDLAFHLEGNLSPVPAPPAIVLAGIALAGVAARRLRRSAAATA
jgi:hypothetical protein